MAMLPLKNKHIHAVGFTDAVLTGTFIPIQGMSFGKYTSDGEYVWNR